MKANLSNILPKLIFNVYIKHIAHGYLWILVTSGCNTAPCNLECQIEKVCDCVVKANGNMVKLTRCYNKAKIIQKNNVLVTQANDFETAIQRCFGAAVLDEIIKKSF